MISRELCRSVAAACALLSVLLAAHGQENTREIGLTLHPRLPESVASALGDAKEPITWPFTFGVPLPKGTLKSDRDVGMLSPEGTETPIQVRTTARWRDGSVKWLLIDCQAPLSKEAVAYRLQCGGKVTRGRVPAAKIALEQDAASVTLNTGKLELVLSKKDMRIFQSVRLPGEGDGVFPKGAHSDLWLEDQSGKVYRGSWADSPEVVVEESGPIRVAVKIEGWTQSEDGQKLGRHIVRIYAFAGKSYLRMYHTFVKTADSNEVKYRNIAFHVPFAGNQYQFRGAGDAKRLEGKQSDYLLQYRHNEYEVVSAGKVASTGRRARGSVSVSSGGTAYTVSMRHFWQNFPKEIEVTPGLLRLHFWPRHGKPAVHLGENMTAKNIGFLWWVHEGEMLDFRLPDEVYNFSYTKRPYDNIRASRQANAFGIAKTHEYFLDFHGGGTPGTDLTAEIFNANPMMVVAPQCIADSKAFYDIAPRSDEHAEMEEAIERTLMFLPAMMERIGDYGMWNFGSYHQSYLPTLDAAGIHRHWPGFHHGGPRWPWLVFVRSGAPRFFDFAEAHSRHLMDTCTANWEDPAYNKKYWRDEGWWGHNMTLKYKGGICRYKGLVHWFAGMRMFYNCQVDYALWHYYLTGYQRAWDVAMAHGEFLLRARDQIDDPKSGRVYLSRSGMARGCMAITLYDATHDERYLELAREQMAHFTKHTDANPDAAYREVYYAPFVERYYAVLDDKKLEPYIVRWGRDRMAEQRAWNGRDQFYDLMALCYQLTGDVAFLKYGLAQARVMLEDRAANADPILEGMIPSAFSGAVGYLGQQWGDFVNALNEHRQKTGEQLQLPRLPDCLPCRGQLWATTWQPQKRGERTHRLVMHVRKQKAEAIDIPFKFTPVGTTIVTIEGPDGKAVTGQEVAPQEGKLRYDLRVAGDAPSGDYRVEFFVPSPKGYFHRNLPIRGNYSKLVIEQPFWMREARGAPRFHFYPIIKKGGKTGRIRIQTRIRDKCFQTHRLYRPDGKLFWVKTEQGHVNAPTDTTIEIPPEWQGKVWLYSRGGLGKSDGVMLSGDVLPVFAVDRDHFFVPERFRALAGPEKAGE